MWTVKNGSGSHSGFGAVTGFQSAKSKKQKKKFCFFFRERQSDVKEMGGQNFPLETGPTFLLQLLVFSPLKKRGADSVSKKGVEKEGERGRA